MGSLTLDSNTHLSYPLVKMFQKVVIGAFILVLANGFPQFSGPAFPNAAHTSLADPTLSAHPNAAHTFARSDCARFSGAFPCAPGDDLCAADYKASGCGR